MKSGYFSFDTSLKSYNLGVVLRIPRPIRILVSISSIKNFMCFTWKCEFPCCVHGKVGTVLAPMPLEGLYPAIGLQSESEEVKVILDAEWEHKDVIHMSIDNCDEDWFRLHDVKLNGQVHSPPSLRI